MLVETSSGSEAGSYLRLIDSCITQLKAQGPARTCNESKVEEEGVLRNAKLSSAQADGTRSMLGLSNAKQPIEEEEEGEAAEETRLVQNPPWRQPSGE